MVEEERWINSRSAQSTYGEVTDMLCPVSAGHACGAACVATCTMRHCQGPARTAVMEPSPPALPLPRSGGVEALALLTSNPAVRELLVRPLAIRMVSLRRYIHSSLPSVPEATHPFGSAAATAGEPQAMAAAAGRKEADLSGMGEGDDEAAVPREAQDGPLTGMQRLASTVREMAQGML